MSKTPLISAAVLWIPILLAWPSGWPKMENLWLGLELTGGVIAILTVYGLRRRRGRPFRGGVRWFFAWCALTLLGAWIGDHRVPDHQTARLGGWISGHSNLIAAINGATTHDYSLMSSPNHVSVAINADATLAATDGGHELMIWAVDSASALCTTRIASYQRFDHIWVGDTLYQLEYPSSRPKEEETLLHRFPVADMVEGRCESMGTTKLLPVLAHCATAQEFFVAQPEGDGVVVRALQRDVVTTASTTGGFEPRAAPIVAITGIHLDRADWSFAPGCRWILWSTSQRSPSETGTIIEGHRLEVAPGSTPEPVTTTLPHGRYEQPFTTKLTRDGRYLVSLTRKALLVYDTVEHQTKTKAGDFGPRYMSGGPDTLRIGPSGRYFVLSERSTGINASPGVVSVHDSVTLEEQLRYVGHGDAIVSTALSLDGKYMITGSRDQTARIWETPR